MNDSAAPAPELEQGLFALLGAARSLHERLERALEGAGLSTAKFQALDQLAKAGNPLALSELAGCLGCVRSNVTQLVDRLEADGLVKRLAHPEDRRAIQAALTPLGVERHAAGLEAMRQVQAELAARLDPSQRDALLRAIASLS